MPAIAQRLTATPFFLAHATLLPIALAAVACSSSHKSTTPSAAQPPHDAGMPAPAATATPSDLDCAPASADWSMFGQNACNTGAQPAAGGISVDTVKNLKTKWTYNAAGDISATPAVVGNAVYVADWGGMVSRIDATTGMAVWSKSVGDLVQSSLTSFISRTTPVVTDDAVIFGTQRSSPDIVVSQGAGAYVIALDPMTGNLKWKTQMDTHPAAVITSSPVVDGTHLYVGVASLEEGFGLTASNYQFSFRGSVAALDLTNNGAILWQTHTITDAAYYADGGAPAAAPEGGTSAASDGGDDGGSPAAPAPTLSGFAGASVWSSSPTVDRKRHQLYVTTGNNYQAPANVTGPVDGNWVDSVLALDLDTGKIKWGRSLPQCGMPGGMDVFSLTSPVGPDSDFGCGVNLFTTTIDSKVTDLVGAGQKCGDYWAFNPDTGDTVWMTEVGPGGSLGGLHWGTSTDGIRIYTEVNNGKGTPWAIRGNGPQAGQMSSTGLWAALDTATGQVIWQIADPAMSGPVSGATVDGPTVVVNGVVFAGSMDAMGTMFAFNAATGDVLWQFQSGGTVYGGPAVANGVVYWGCGYPSGRLGFGTTCKKLYAFSVSP